MTRVPVLLYHSIAEQPAPFIARFSTPPDQFRRHLELIAQEGLTPMYATAFANVLRGRSRLPRRPVVITFDDGLADFHDTALPALRAHGFPVTLFVPTALLRDSPERLRLDSVGDSLLSWSQLREIEEAGAVEIGSHSHTHPHLDTLGTAAARDELTRSKALLEAELGHRVMSFAYPNGYSSPRIRRLVAATGYDAAYSVKNAFSSPADDVLSIARLMLMRATTIEEVRAWLAGRGAPDSAGRERMSTRLWRAYRRARAVARRRPGSDLV